MRFGEQMTLGWMISDGTRPQVLCTALNAQHRVRDDVEVDV